MGGAGALRDFVREALPDDDAALAVLDAEWRDAARSHRGAVRLLAEDPHRLGLATLRGLAGWRVLVAGVDGAVLGALALATTGSVATISRVYVTADARGLGIGEAMVARALDASWAGGCRSVDAIALPGDRETKNLYERTGLVARLIVASRDRPDGTATPSVGGPDAGGVSDPASGAGASR